MSHAVTFLFALAGFAVLLVAMPRHQHDWLGGKLAPGAMRPLRLGGFALLALGFAAAASGLGWADGAVAWLGWLTLAAALVVAANTNRRAGR